MMICKLNLTRIFRNSNIIYFKRRKYPLRTSMMKILISSRMGNPSDCTTGEAILGVLLQTYSPLSKWLLKNSPTTCHEPFSDYFFFSLMQFVKLFFFEIFTLQFSKTSMCSKNRTIKRFWNLKKKYFHLMFHFPIVYFLFFSKKTFLFWKKWI